MRIDLDSTGRIIISLGLPTLCRLASQIQAECELRKFESSDAFFDLVTTSGVRLVVHTDPDLCGVRVVMYRDRWMETAGKAAMLNPVPNVNLDLPFGPDGRMLIRFRSPTRSGS